MKKLATTAVITTVLLFSCQSTGKAPESLSDSTVTAIEKESEASDSEKPADSQTDSDTDTDSQTDSDTDTDSELAAEPVEELFVTEHYIPEEEKISDEEIEKDLSVAAALAEEKTETVEKSEEVKTEDVDSEKSSSEEVKTEVKTETKTDTGSSKEVKTASQTDVKKSETISNKSTSPVKKEETKTQNKNESVVKESTSSLDMQKEAAQASDEINARKESEKAPEPSRKIAISNNQFLDINYPGTGWVYLGEVERENLLVFHGRKINDDTTTFTLRSRKSGTAILHFYKNDNLSGKYIDDYIEVSVNTESATDNIHVTSPEYSKIVPPKPQKPEPKAEESSQNEKEIPDKNKTEYTYEEPVQAPKKQDADLNIHTIIQNSKNNDAENESTEVTQINRDTVSSVKSIEENTSAEYTGDLLEQAQKAYDDKQYSKALGLVQAFLADTSDRFDEGLYLEGQILEANSEVQNIKEAIKDYNTLVKNWPSSRLWKKAKERSIYLQRFYIDIR